MAITASRLFDPSVTEEIGEMLNDGLPFGDAVAFAELAQQTAKLLGFEILSPLDSRNLKPRIRRKPGLYNAAISVIAEWSGFTRALREELRYLQSRTDWASTAAAHLVPNGFVSEQAMRPPTGPLAAPLECNHAQEQTLQQFRTKSLTVVTGPPGTGKTQLVINAVTNSWLDGEKALATSEFPRCGAPRQPAAAHLLVSGSGARNACGDGSVALIQRKWSNLPLGANWTSG